MVYAALFGGLWFPLQVRRERVRVRALAWMRKL